MKYFIKHYMKRTFSLTVLLALCVAGVFGQQINWSKIDPLLEQQLRESNEERIKVTIHLEDQVDLIAMMANFELRGTSIHDRRVAVVTALKQKAQNTQGPLLAWLESQPGIESSSIQSMWISNGIRAKMDYDAIAALSHREGVEILMFEPRARVDDADAASHAAYLPAPETVGGREVGLSNINAPALWAMGYTGIGKKVLIIDSGVSLTHPAHTRNYYGNQVGNTLAWYNPGGPKEPFDCDEHGTHVTGVAVGMQLSTRDTFGVAFNATWMGSPAVDGGTVANNCPFDVDDLDALQWALDPDGDPTTTDDMPDVINGSYGLLPQFFNVAMCTGTALTQRMNALEAASVTFVQSAGNYGPGDSTMGAYKNVNTTLVNSFTIGSVSGGNPNFPINGFSSRGPSRCGGTGSLLIKPEVVAPGNNVRSSVPGGGFKLLGGTSFSAPHVSGAALLLHEAFPTATSTQVKEALYFTAVDLGPVGEDNAYGNGIIDVLAAFNYLVADGFTPVPVSREKDVILAEVMSENLVCGQDITPEIVLENNGTSVINSAKIDYTYSDGSSASFTWTGTLNPGADVLVTLPTQTFPIGAYDINVNVSEVDGQSDYFYLDNQGSSSFSILGDDALVVTNTFVNPAGVCGNSQALLTASTGLPGRSPAWFSNATGTNLLYVGDQFLTPPISASTLYFVGTVGQEFVGIPDNTVGNSFPSFNVGSFLEFEVFVPITLKSVVVYASATGARTIQLRNMDDAVLGAKPTGSLVMGKNQIDLDFKIAPGKYRLGLGGSSAELLATVTGVTFPYEIPGVMSIDKSDNSFYSFFYNWEVEYRGACNLIQAAVAVVPGNAAADFTADNTTVDLGSSGTVNFTNASTGASTYAWSFGDGNTSTDLNPSHTYTQPGTYLVTLSAKAAGGCIDADTLSITVNGFPTSLDKLQSSYGKVQLYPNPSAGIFTLDLQLHQAYQVELEVVDLVGKRMWKQAPQRYHQAKSQIDLTTVPDGVYLLLVRIDGITLSEKLIKHQ